MDIARLDTNGRLTTAMSTRQCPVLHFAHSPCTPSVSLTFPWSVIVQSCNFSRRSN